MITYELAKKLKDAGFVQGYMYGSETLYGPEYSATGMTAAESENHKAYGPTLSELIEACGKWISGIEMNCTALWDPTTKDLQPVKATGWKHELHTYEDGVVLDNAVGSIQEWGHTPEEAVAKLWLAINYKANLRS